jgi:hypothetical protein
VNVEEELKESPDLTVQVFRFLSRVIAGVGGLSVLLLFATAGRDRITVLWFAGITLAISFSLRSIGGRRVAVPEPVVAEVS